MQYKKSPHSIDDQIELLKERGLTIDEKDLANHYLTHVSYYRLAGYWWPMQSDKEKHIFKEGSLFSDVIHLYNFDRELKLLVFDVIEKIEISLRTKLIYHLSHEYDPWWFENVSLFNDSQALIKTLYSLQEEVERSKETFMKEHKKKYKNDCRFPPAWKTLELTSFGGLSKLYGNLKNTIKSKDVIAEDFGAVNHTYLPSWLQSIAQIRNICAHHARLWNKNLPGTVKLLSKPPKAWIADVPKQHEFQRLYIHLCIMKYMVNIIAPENTFTKRLLNLFEKYPSVDPNALGMKENWEKEDLWK
ncbi:Abi family protein [Marivirga arenosa]|uniref:Abi family protein n=1 Tax=Marivirga arenosa TaxID=3059076 RepID=A0AA49JHB0_9BACT|nr:Abi family protein [Marivirga sp. BKB1-2]WKK79335.2 Abi family protein [Marivirga sp. BKB1-2]